MTQVAAVPAIRLRGVRHNNLKNFNLDLPVHQLIVVTGLSGSGKSSLAFDTLYAEGQRRYIETFSPYARQFFDRMDKPRVDSIQGIPPAIAIEQRNTVKSTRSTVGTMTEICDYLKFVWGHLAQLHCRQCGQPVQKDPPQGIWDALRKRTPPVSALEDPTLHCNRKVQGCGRAPQPAPGPGYAESFAEARAGAPPSSTEESAASTQKASSGNEAPEILITFELALSEKISLEESLALITKQGYQRLLRESPASNSASRRRELEILRLDETLPQLQQSPPKRLTVLQDRIRLTEANRARFIEACEQAYHFGQGKLVVYGLNEDKPRRFSNQFHCAECDLEYREPAPALFNFNHPMGACPTCRGFGRTIAIDYDLAIPNRALSLADGAVKPWQSGQSAECQDDLIRFCKRRKVPTSVPFQKLSRKWQDWVLNGDPGYGKDTQHEWPHAWYGVKGYFRWLESKAYKMHVRVLLSRYRAYRTCPDCRGARFQPEALLYQIPNDEGRLVTLADFYRFTISEALRFVEMLSGSGRRRPAEADDRSQPNHAAKSSDPFALALEEVHSRLRYLVEVGLGYLSLDRPTRTLSGGETERVNLTSCLGSRLVNTLFVLDEPSVGLHPRDTERLIRILQRLRDAGNTVVVVEHEAEVIRAANQIVDLGPGHGEQGGELVFQGSYPEILNSSASLTGQYLSGQKRIEISTRRPVSLRHKKLVLSQARLHNLKDLTVEIPLERFVCVTGVSGSGKTSLVRGVLLPTLAARIQSPKSGEGEKSTEPGGQKPEDGEEGSKEDAAADKQFLPTSDFRPPSSELSGAEHLGRVVLVDQSPIGKTPRSNPAVYVGAFDHIRELFAESDAARQGGLNASAFSFNSAQGQCEACRGAGFEKIEMQFLSDVYIRCSSCEGRRYRPHILEVKIGAGGDSGRDIADLLGGTIDEGIRFLASFTDSRPARRAVQSLRLLEEVGLGYLRLGQPINTLSGGESQRLKLVSHLASFADANSQDSKPALFLFDEPTTGLHFHDVGVLLKVFQRLVKAGHTVLVIEHNLDVIKCADWLIDLGPEAGERGGRIVTQGTPERVATCSESHTGFALTKLLKKQPRMNTNE